MESKDFHASNAVAADLEQRMGVAYVAVVQRAGRLRNTLTEYAAGFDTLRVSHVEGRYRAVLMLEGMVMALRDPQSRTARQETQAGGGHRDRGCRAHVLSGGRRCRELLVAHRASWQPDHGCTTGALEDLPLPCGGRLRRPPQGSGSGGVCSWGPVRQGSAR
jgi:hypothetical protein